MNTAKVFFDAVECKSGIVKSAVSEFPALIPSSKYVY
jgi:hypothetical protein